MRRQAVYFAAPRRVEIREEALPPPSADEVTVRTVCSAISPGTELLIYRGQAPAEMEADSTIAVLADKLRFPLKYGYAAVGEVIALGKGVSPDWLGRRVFAFNPHESAFNASVTALLPIPAQLEWEQAVFLPNMETAVNLVQDGRPLLGERVLVFGQGVVGLLVTALLARFPLESLWVVDHLPARREQGLSLGAGQAFAPQELPPVEADLIFEVSGNPAALDQAIQSAAFEGRVIIGSWYGRKRAALNLGERFHRQRITLISSQVSTLAADLTARWDKARRFETAWRMIAAVAPERLITHRLPLGQAAAAYHLLDTSPETCLQPILLHQTDERFDFAALRSARRQ